VDGRLGAKSKARAGFNSFTENLTKAVVNFIKTKRSDECNSGQSNKMYVLVVEVIECAVGKKTAVTVIS